MQTSIKDLRDSKKIYGFKSVSRKSCTKANLELIGALQKKRNSAMDAYDKNHLVVTKKEI